MEVRDKNKRTVQGIVLRSVPQGEYDKRMVILTKEKGRITVFARGARRARSSFSGKTNPFSFGVFEIGTGSSAYYLKQADISNYFPDMISDYERSCYGFYFLELAEYYSREESEGTELLGLLYQTLRALEKGTIDYTLVRVIYELKIFVLNGEYPEVFACMECGKRIREGYFYSGKGGIMCGQCRYGEKQGLYIGEAALYTMQYIVSAQIKKLYTFAVTTDVLRNLRKVMDEYCSRYIDGKFRSLEVLEELLAMEGR